MYIKPSTHGLAHIKYSVHILPVCIVPRLLSGRDGSAPSLSPRGLEMGSGRRYDPRLPGSSRRGKTLASPLTWSAAPSPAAGSRCSRPGGARKSPLASRGEDMARRPQPGPHPPACQASAPGGGSPAPARRPAGERRSRRE